MTADTTKTPRRQPWLGRPALGIRTTWPTWRRATRISAASPAMRQGVLDASGYPLRFPVSSLGGVTMCPAAMPLNPLALNRDK